MDNQASITAGIVFPHPVLTKIVGRPSYNSLHILLKEIYANLISVPSVCGNGTLGHLKIAMPDAAYAKLSKLPFVTPTHPSVKPPHATGQTGQQINEINHQYLQDIQEFTHFIQVQTLIQQQIIAAVDRVYIAQLEDPLFGFAKVSCEHLMNYLAAQYGNITEPDYASNWANLTKPWDSNQTPIEGLWTHLLEVQCKSIVFGEPILDIEIIRVTLQHFMISKIFTDYTFQVWNDMSTADKQLLSEFITFFTDANVYRLDQLRLTGIAGGNAGGYPGAALAATVTVPPTGSPKKKFVARTHIYYCWMCGKTTNPAHTSSTCHNKSTGHKDESTMDNPMGGCLTDFIPQFLRARTMASVAAATTITPDE